MPVVAIRRAAGLVLLGKAVILLAWGLWPLPVQIHRVAIPLSDLQPASPVAATGGDQGGLLTLDWPVWVRTGEVFRVSLALLPSESAGVEAARLPNKPALVHARLELPGMASSPPGETSQALPQDRPARFSWRVRADRPQVYSGTAWLHLQPMPGTERIILSAPRIHIRARSFLGISGPWARGLGSAGVVLGAVFGLDAAAAAVWKKINAQRG